MHYSALPSMDGTKLFVLLEDMGAQVNYAETYDAYGMKTSALGLAAMRGYNSTVRFASGQEGRRKWRTRFQS